MAKAKKTSDTKPQSPTIICHETKQGIKCTYDGPIYQNPEPAPKPKPKPKGTYTF